ncbi:hypothetical protein O0L34_g12538 [Tuta absoluta]|nr:hypothetical protein O0L34_g12538 [Tuta absoluta]
MYASSSEQAEREITESLQYSIFCMRRLGLAFDPPKSQWVAIRLRLILGVSLLSVIYHLFSDIAYIVVTLPNSPKFEDVIPFFHIFGYGVLSCSKVFALWYKKDVFGKLIQELATIWPVSSQNKIEQEIKNNSLAALRATSIAYFLVNMIGVWVYNLTPIVVFLYEYYWQKQSDAKIGFIWFAWYPFDKHKPFGHVVVYIFEMFIGQTCVWIMIANDILFTAMASHISLLLRLLQRRLEDMTPLKQQTISPSQCYQEIVDNIKLHQRLIRYCNDLEDAFTLSNLFNYVFSSINICCVIFVIAFLEPFFALGSKLFLISALIQMGMICYYGDDILHANAQIANAAYNSGWYRTNPQCRRALQLLMRRAQKPIAFTAMKFTNISLMTYSSILTRAYSYFALLYTKYSQK